ncbi:dicarboxylate/amino acid:cation symporter [Paramaledivibacter caminithermalis]|uniref:Na+/H+-dicarboxylate symporter n=1 Tax=Paramaledivibacter caminithermalis (strain DSM 15212 / CIP 107654 / DViRD3) TaxID=1121301 RepID=A0A1M6QIQ5_PARC5|nr:dicarboxylate/amino acid:cation symporter [Paramaledivibacter caminithermalis]SHK20194.1 Na+/H+-dicarboxylate symporter [Paramaledivibacter caminithermalis DSM 15212]
MKKMKLTTKIFLGLILGIVVGLFMQSIPNVAQTYIKPFGTLFLNMIKMIIVPLVFSSLIVGAASIGDPKSLGRIGGKTIVYYLATTAIAVSIGLLLGKIIHPGSGLTIPVDANSAAAEAPSIVSTLLNIIPKNPLKGLVEGNILQVITFALFLGIGCTAIGEKSKSFVSFFESLANIMYKITSFIMELAPYGIFALIVPVVSEYGIDVLKPLSLVIFAVYLGCILHALIVYSSAVKIFGKLNPTKFLKGIAPAAITAFSTTSSSGTLPVTIKCTRENLGISEKIASFVLPLGATINMDGTALYQGVCALFIAQVYGIELTLAQMATIVLTATLGSIGTAGVPGGGFIMLTLVLQSVGLPLDGLVLIGGIDRILDMARTSVNVVGDASCAVVVAATEDGLDPVTQS